MKILFFSHYFYPEGNAPGTRVYEMTRRWVREGHDVTVVTCVPNVPDGIPYEGYKNLLFQEENIQGVRVVRVWTWMAANRGAFRRILNYLSYVPFALWGSGKVEDADVIIATSPQFFCGWAGAIAAEHRKRHFILEIRDVWPDSIEAVGAIHSRCVLSFLSELERKLYEKADLVVTVGEGYAKQLMSRSVSKERIAIIPNGVDLDKFTPRDGDDKFRERYGLKGCFVCSYVGTIGMAAGLDAVIGAALQIKAAGRSDIRFLLVGAGAKLEWMRTAVERSNLDNVVLTGMLSKEEVISALAASDACLVHLRKAPLFTAVMPSKIYEAAAMARPIVLGVEGFAEQIVKQAEAGICVEPENARQIADAVMMLADNPGLAQTFGRNARERIATSFDYNRLANEYLAVIAETTRKRPIATYPR